MNIFKVKEPQLISEVVNEFRYKAGPFVVRGDRIGVKKLFARTLAGLRQANPDEQLEAKAEMREALRDILLEPSRRVKRGWFDDL